MPDTPATPEPLAAEAAQAAASAAARCGSRVVELTEIDQYRQAAQLLADIWRTADGHYPLTPDALRALAYSGNYVCGAYQDDRLVGTAAAWRGQGHLHSHIAGVVPALRAGGIGYAIKQHQRAWSLARDIPEVHWTFDPLIRRNAYFNLHKLGATATGYLPDFYGSMTDGINLGDASDRIYLRWRLASAKAVAAAAGERAELDQAAWCGSGAAVLLARTGDGTAAERPVSGGELPADGRPVLVAVPADAEELRARDRGLAAEWRSAVRAALCSALATGYQITGVSKDGYYLLRK